MRFFGCSQGTLPVEFPARQAPSVVNSFLSEREKREGETLFRKPGLLARCGMSDCRCQKLAAIIDQTSDVARSHARRGNAISRSSASLGLARSEAASAAGAAGSPIPTQSVGTRDTLLHRMPNGHGWKRRPVPVSLPNPCFIGILWGKS